MRPLFASFFAVFLSSTSLLVPAIAQAQVHIHEEGDADALSVAHDPTMGAPLGEIDASFRDFAREHGLARVIRRLTRVDPAHAMSERHFRALIPHFVVGALEAALPATSDDAGDDERGEYIRRTLERGESEGVAGLRRALRELEFEFADERYTDARELLDAANDPTVDVGVVGDRTVGIVESLLDADDRAASERVLIQGVALLQQATWR